MSKPINEAIWDGGFRFFPNYFKGLYRIEDEEARGKFALAIIDFMFLDKVPEFEPNSDEEWIWEMIYPNLVSSKKRAENGRKAKGKGTGPRPAMNGNRNARKTDDGGVSDFVNGVG